MKIKDVGMRREFHVITEVYACVNLKKKTKHKLEYAGKTAELLLIYTLNV